MDYMGGAVGSFVGSFREFARGTSGELSYRKSSDAWRATLGSFIEENPSELIKTHGFSVVWEMIEDDTVKPCLEGLKRTRLRADPVFEPASEDPADVKIRDEVERDINNMQGQFKNDLYEIGTYREAGFSITEIARDKTADSDMRRPLRRLATRDPEGWRFDTDPHGNLKEKGLVQRTSGGQDLRFDPWHFLVCVNNKRFDNWYGQSDLGSAYRPWFYKKHAWRFYMQGLERHGNPWWEGKLGMNAPPGASDTVAEVLASIQSGTEITSHEWLDIIQHTLPAGALNVFKDAILMLNAAIASGLLAPEHLGFTQTDGGAYSKGVAQTDLWLGIVEDFGADLEAVINEQLIRRHVDLHYPNVTAYPTMKFPPLTEDDKKEFAEVITQAVTAGVVGNITRTDIAWVRDRLGMPEAEDIQKDPDTGEVQDAPTFSFSPRMFAKRTYKRAFTAHEKRVNFPEIQDRTEVIVDACVSEMSALVAAMQDDLIKRVDTMVVPKGAQESAKEVARKAIKGHTLPGVRAMTDTVKAALVMEHLGGKLDVKSEYEKAAGKKMKLTAEHREFADAAGVHLIPAAARAYFKGKVPFTAQELALLSDKAFWITDVTRERILREAKAILYKALAKGDPAWARTELRTLFSQYLESTGQLNDKGELLSPHRIETIVRTNLSEAYNGGRMKLMQDPDVDGIVAAYQYSAIMDNNTTDYCAAMDGRVFDKDEIEAPPAHFNCRSVLVPVFTGDTFTLTTQADIRDEYRKAGKEGRMKPWREKPIDPDRIQRARTFTMEVV